MTGISKGAIKVVAALDHAAGELAKKNKVKNAKEWAKEIIAARAALSPAAAGADAARTARSRATPDVEAARAEWLRIYDAAKLIVEGEGRPGDG